MRRFSDCKKTKKKEKFQIFWIFVFHPVNLKWFAYQFFNLTRKFQIFFYIDCLRFFFSFRSHKLIQFNNNHTTGSLCSHGTENSSFYYSFLSIFISSQCDTYVHCLAHFASSFVDAIAVAGLVWVGKRIRLNFATDLTMSSRKIKVIAYFFLCCYFERKREKKTRRRILWIRWNEAKTKILIHIWIAKINKLKGFSTQIIFGRFFRRSF